MWWLVFAFVVVGGLEAVLGSARRSPTFTTRWTGNLVLYMIGSALFLLPFLGGAMAACVAMAEGWGLLHRVALPWALELVIGVLLFDLAVYALHRVNHRIEPLWRLHAVHHSDPAIDISTTLRQHPLALLLAAFVFATVTAALALPPDSVALYVSVQIFVSLLSHADLQLPARLDRALSWVVVTPRVHRLHHSRHRPETDSNYGEVFTVWDRLFGTYRDPSRVSTQVFGPAFGLDRFRDLPDQQPHRLLLQPFVGATTPRAKVERINPAPA